ncbi:DUF2817 domain-containing protein [Novosphingobium arvoryzae]|uniref:DUF2817 domain-containing protein n=1 Tax=Novosphingobium arvoryzae TaxID=1256514 RepID=UPI0035716709
MQIVGVNLTQVGVGQEARSKFLEAAARADGSIESIAHPERGPDGRTLFTDVASFGPAQAEKVLVLISGTTGRSACSAMAVQSEWWDSRSPTTNPPP